jgi:DNA-binding protein H-NS
MKPHDLESMSVDELWSLHEFVASELASKISAKKARLDERLRQLDLDLDLGGVPHHGEKISRARRPYPQVLPKYRNPAEPSETWSGRGKQPRWLTAQLRSGKKLDDFRIQPSSNRGAALRKVMTLINKKVQPAVISIFGF